MSSEKPDSTQPEPQQQPKNESFELWTEEDEKRLDIIGSNGNDGDHYDKSSELFEDL